jgi:hypothetical protein
MGGVEVDEVEVRVNEDKQKQRGRAFEGKEVG